MAEIGHLAHIGGQGGERGRDVAVRRCGPGFVRHRRDRRVDRSIDPRALGAQVGHCRERRREAAQARLRALVGRADRVLASRARQRQDAARSDRAEQHGADDGALVARHVRHVEGLDLARVGADDGEQLGSRGAAVAGHHLLGRRQAAAGRAEDVGAIARRHAGADLAHRLEQLRRREQIEAAGDRMETEHGPASAELSGRDREDLDVVRRRAGALRDARNRRALRAEARAHGGLDEPLGEDAAAFATERRDEDADRLHAACSVRTIERRIPARRRSCQRAFCTTSPR